MTAPDGFDRRLTAWLEEQAPMREPDDLLRTVERGLARTRRLPGPVLLERWLPMQTQARLGAIPRSAIILVTLGLLAALLTVIAIGAQPVRLPQPFGPARNGPIVFGSPGDIWVAEADGSDPRPLLTSPETEFQPTFSNDGTRLMFLRTDGDDAMLMVADADGSDVRPLTSEPLVSVSDWWPSPDGSLVAVISRVDGANALSLVPTDGSAISRLPLDGVPVGLNWAPDGTRLLIRTDDGAAAALWSVPIDGGGPTVMATAGTGDLDWSFHSPDGKSIAYRSRVARGTEDVVRTLIANADGSDPRQLEVSPDHLFEGGAQWSPDGTHLVLLGQLGTGADTRWTVAVVPVTGDEPLLSLDPVPDLDNVGWSPDGETVWTWRQVDGVVSLIDVATGTSTTVPWTTDDWPTWQRLAP